MSHPDNMSVQSKSLFDWNKVGPELGLNLALCSFCIMLHSVLVRVVLQWGNFYTSKGRFPKIEKACYQKFS